MKHSNIHRFLVDIAENEIMKGKKYSVRIAIDDGGDNSYVAIDINTEEFRRKKPVTRGIAIHRHTNSANHLINTWYFELGGVCHPYEDNKNIPLEFSSYGKSREEAEIEAIKYYDRLKKLIRKQTSDYQIEAAETAQEEREKLLERLAELEGC